MTTSHLSLPILIEATARLTSALHIGAGTDASGDVLSIARAGLENAPYMPGSSLKGRMRSLLGSCVVDATSPDGRSTVERLLGSTGRRGALSFWDCPIEPAWAKERQEAGHALWTLRRTKGVATEAKSRGPRHAMLQREVVREVVPEGTPFRFRVTLEASGAALLPWVLTGLKLLEWEGLGGGTSRGMGRIRFERLRIAGEDAQARLDEIAQTPGVLA